MKRLLKAALLLCLYLFPQTVFSQSDSLFVQADALRESGELKQALSLYYQYQEKMMGQLSIREDASLTYKMAACYFNLSDYDSTVKYMNYALVQKGKILDRSDTFLLSAHAVMGYIYRYEKPDIRKAAAHFDDQRSIMGAFPDKFKPLQVYNNYFNLASANRELEDYNRAINYAYQALEIAQTITDKPQLAENCYLVIANCLTGKKRYDRADEFYLKKLKVNIEQRGKQHASLALDYYNIAINDNDRNRPNEAISHFQQAERIASKHDVSLLPDIYRELAVSYRILGRQSQSLQSLYKALSFKSGSPLNIAWTYRQIADHFDMEQQYDSAYSNYQKGLKALIPEFDWSDLNENPSLPSLETSNPFVYKLLELKAGCLLRQYSISQELDLLKQAKTVYELLDNLTDSYRNNLVLESSRLFFQQENHQIYQKALEVEFELYQQSNESVYLENCWRLIEKNKSILLLENLLEAEKESGMKLPDSVIDVRRDISAKILKAQKDLRTCESSDDCGEDKLILLHDIQSRNEDLLRLQRYQIKQDFTDYYNFAENQDLTTISDLQSSLKAEQVIINYFESDQYYYTIAVDNEKAELSRIARSNELTETLNTFLIEVSGDSLAVNGIKKSYDTFAKTSHELFISLLPERVRLGSYKNVIVIPDGELAGIPFEALIQKMPSPDSKDFSALDYMIRDYSINYGFSATLWKKNIESDQETTLRSGLVAFGTSSTNDVQLARLSAVKEEMNNLQSINNVRVFAEASATEANFKKEVVEANMIHLALHNINDYENPLNSQLIFNGDTSLQDSRLFLYEIFSVTMNPSLVVLSGCETGVGKWIKGEGAYHMGRGFLYHGNPALVMSLWKVRDASTAKIMKSFYSELEESNSSESIRLAKLDFIETADPLTAHPSNWAAFVSIGQTTKTKSYQYPQWLWYFLAGVISLMILKAVRKHNAHQTAS